MAKYKYDCACGKLSLRRGELTRRQFAGRKMAHADPDGGKCCLMARELRKSGKAVPDPWLQEAAQ